MAKRKPRTDPQKRRAAPSGTRRKDGKSRQGRPPRAHVTDEQKRRIVSYIEAGGAVDSSAKAAGIASRTLRELRQRARGNHPTRSALPHLKAFFEEVDQAIGRRLIANEIWVSEHDPKYALKYLRSRLGSEGEDEEPVRVPTADEMQQELDVLVSSDAFHVPQCQDENCPCRYHRPKGRSS